MEDRVLLTGAIDTSFGVGGKATVAFDLGGNLEDEARSMALQPDGRIVLAGSAQTGITTYDFAVARLTRSGALDTTFNGTGKQVVAFNLGGNIKDRAFGVVVQQDGMIDVVGSAQTPTGFVFAVARLTPSGQLDTGFNGTGKATVSFDLGGDNDDEAQGVALQADGKIVVAGYAQISASNKLFAVARFNGNGSLDSSFNGSGKLTFTFGAGTRDDEARGVTVQPDGRIVVVGFTQSSPGNNDFAIARLNSNGTFDVGFNGNGRQVVSFDLGGGRNDTARAVALQADGKIVVAGVAERLAPNYDFAVVRLNTNGTLDPTFNGTGKTTVAFDLGGGNDDEANTVSVQPNGKIVVAGFAEVSSPNYDFGVARLNANGSLDSSFNQTGKQVVPFGLGSGSNQDEAFAVAIQPDGKILAAGIAQRAGLNFDFAITRIDGTTTKFFAVAGTPGMVCIYRPDGTSVASFNPYPGYQGDISVAFGDVNGDGVDDLIVGARQGNPHVKVYNGAAFANGTFNPHNPDASLLTQFFPYALQFNVGANLAAADVEGDGYADIITGATAGNPDVRIYSGRDIAGGHFNPAGSSLVAEFFPYALQFNVGAFVAAGNITGSGFADVVTGASAGNPDVRVYRGVDIARRSFQPASSSMLAQFFAFGLNFNVGATVAVGDTNGDGFADVIAGSSVGNPQVKVYDGRAMANGTFNRYAPDTNLLTQFFAYDTGSNLGVAVGAADFDHDGIDDIVTGPLHGGTPNYRVVHGNATGTRPPAVMEGTAAGIAGGIFVGA
jgi:uncharacterized delta-60 repeat protein